MKAFYKPGCWPWKGFLEMVSGILLVLYTGVLFAGTLQTKDISGQVLDKSGAPYVGVTLMIKGIPGATLSDKTGNFTFSNIKEGDELTVSAIGEKTITVKIGKENFYKITMGEGVVAMNRTVQADAVTFSGAKAANPDETLVKQLKQRYPGYFIIPLDNFYRIYSTKSMGACDLTGKEIIPPGKYTDVILLEGCYKSYYSVKIGDKEGVCDLSGKEVIPPDKYTGVVLQNGYYGVKRGDKEGVCDLKGKEIIAPDKYTDILLHDGYYMVQVGDKEGVCDLNGKEIVPCKYESVRFRDGKFVVRHSRDGNYVAFSNVELARKSREPDHASTNSGKVESQGIADDKGAKAFTLAEEYKALRDYANAVKYYRLAAEQNHVKALFFLGVCYEFGRGVQQDQTEAIKYYRLAADQNHMVAQFNLAICYLQGRGVSKNNTEACKYFRLAAAQNDAPSQYNLGICYFEGKGIKQDYSAAVFWYKKAAEQGYSKAQHNLADCYFRGNGIQQNFELAFKWFLKAAEKGIKLSQFQVGLCYYDGKGVKVDYGQALDWFKKAAEYDNEQIEYANAIAMSYIGNCYNFGTGAKINKDDAKYWYKKAKATGQLNEIQNKIVQDLIDAIEGNSN